MVTSPNNKNVSFVASQLHGDNQLLQQLSYHDNTQTCLKNYYDIKKSASHSPIKQQAPATTVFSSTS
jgi:hypothetical protein